MTLVNIRLSVDDGQPDDPEAPALGWLEWQAYAPGDASRRRADTPDRLVLPGPFRVDLNTSTVTTREVMATTAGWCWKVTEHITGIQPRARYFLVPDQVEVEYRDLVQVDHRTLAANAEPPAAWTLALDEVQQQLTDLDVASAVADYLVANPPAIGALTDLTDVTIGDSTEGDALILGPLGEWGPVTLTPALIGAATAAQGAKADASDVDQITLTGDLVLTLPVGHPVGQVYRAVITQPATPPTGYTVTYGGSPVTVDTTAGASTLVEFFHVGTGWKARVLMTTTPPDDISAAPASGQAAVNALTAGASVTVPATHSMHTLTMTSDTTLAFSNPTAGHAFTLKLSGAFTPTFPASVVWAGGSAPTYAAGKVYVFASFDAGTSWIGSAL